MVSPASGIKFGNGYKPFPIPYSEYIDQYGILIKLIEHTFTECNENSSSD